MQKQWILLLFILMTIVGCGETPEKAKGSIKKPSSNQRSSGALTIEELENKQELSREEAKAMFQAAAPSINLLYEGLSYSDNKIFDYPLRVNNKEITCRFEDKTEQTIKSFNDQELRVYTKETMRVISTDTTCRGIASQVETEEEEIRIYKRNDVYQNFDDAFGGLRPEEVKFAKGEIRGKSLLQVEIIQKSQTMLTLLDLAQGQPYYIYNSLAKVDSDGGIFVLLNYQEKLPDNIALARADHSKLPQVNYGPTTLDTKRFK